MNQLGRAAVGEGSSTIAGTGSSPSVCCAASCEKSGSVIVRT